MSLKPTGTFCPLPWVFLAVRNNGDFRVCCQAKVSGTSGLLRQTDGRPANAGQDTPREARNLPLMKEIRRQMLQGERPPSCVRCQREEESGLRSRRMFENEHWSSAISLESAREVTADDGTIDPVALPVLSYDLRFGNKCNLKCRMCGPEDSDAWVKDYASLWGQPFSGDPGFNWFERGEPFWSELSQNLQHVRHLHIVGGEPLMLKKHYQLLEEIVAQGHSGHITLEYDTNLTILPDRILELWKHFQLVRVGVSLDGVGALNEYIRHPSRWSEIEKNLHRLDQAPGNINAWISTTVQIYNIFSLPELVTWRMQSRFQRLNRSRRKPLISSHPLHRPYYFNLQALPERLKRQATEKLRQYKNEFPAIAAAYPHPNVSLSELELALDRLFEGYINFMWNADLSLHFEKFLLLSAKLDALRGERPFEFPEL